MASIVSRGNSHSVVFRYRNESGELSQRWLSVPTEKEAQTLKETISWYEKNDPDYISRYLEKNYPEKVQASSRGGRKDLSVCSVSKEWIVSLENEKDEPLSPSTLDAYRRITLKSIIPFFKGMKITCITGNDIVLFKNHLSNNHGLRRETVNKYTSVLVQLLQFAVMAKYIPRIPEYYQPGNRKSRNLMQSGQNDEPKGWDHETAMKFIAAVREDYSPECIAAETALCCSLRNGETVGITMANVSVEDGSILIDRELQRTSDKDINVLPRDMVFHRFPKRRVKSSSTLVLIPPKNKTSIRRIYPPASLWRKILRLMEQNEQNKAILDSDYQDSGLRFCFEDGRPMDNDYIAKAFRRIQDKCGIDKDKKIDFQGLRRTGQKLKMDLSGHNAKLVAEMAGHSDVVLQSNYNYATDEDKRRLMEQIERHYYGGDTAVNEKQQ